MHLDQTNLWATIEQEALQPIGSGIPSHNIQNTPTRVLVAALTYINKEYIKVDEAHALENEQTSTRRLFPELKRRAQNVFASFLESR